MTYGALVEVLRQRFPDLVDWDAFHQSCVMDMSHQTQTFGMYSVFIDPDYDDEKQVAHQHRRVADGAPIPTVRIRLEEVVTPEGDPRCDYGVERSQFIPANDDRSSYKLVGQCTRILNHKGEHSFAS